jgi:hypothetical protein
MRDFYSFILFIYYWFQISHKTDYRIEVLIEETEDVEDISVYSLNKTTLRTEGSCEESNLLSTIFLLNKNIKDHRMPLSYIIVIY